jgi:hypothetical protein
MRAKDFVRHIPIDEAAVRLEVGLPFRKIHTARVPVHTPYRIRPRNQALKRDALRKINHELWACVTYLQLSSASGNAGCAAALSDDHQTLIENPYQATDQRH